MKSKSILLITILFSLTLTGCCLKHDWKEATCTEPVTCSKCGKTEGEALGHTWTNATCTEAKTCSVCGATEGEPTPHSWTEANCTTPKTCSVCGTTEGEPTPHTWIEATTEAPKTCSVCGKTEGEPIEEEDNSTIEVDSAGEDAPDATEGRDGYSEKYLKQKKEIDDLYAEGLLTDDEYKELLDFNEEMNGPNKGRGGWSDVVGDTTGKKPAPKPGKGTDSSDPPLSDDDKFVTQDGDIFDMSGADDSYQPNTDRDWSGYTVN